MEKFQLWTLVEPFIRYVSS